MNNNWTLTAHLEKLISKLEKMVKTALRFANWLGTWLLVKSFYQIKHFTVLIDQIMLKVAQGTDMFVILSDLSAAFDMVPHPLLLEKLWLWSRKRGPWLLKLTLWPVPVCWKIRKLKWNWVCFKVAAVHLYYLCSAWMTFTLTDKNCDGSLYTDMTTLFVICLVMR